MITANEKIIRQIENIQIVLFALIAFFMPVNKQIVPFFIILSVLSSLLYFCLRPSSGKWDKDLFLRLLPFLLLFGLYIFGLTYSQNKAAGYFDIETKLSFIAFPVITYFVLANNPRNFCSLYSIRWIAFAFILGCLFLLIRCIYGISQKPDLVFSVKSLFDNGYEQFNRNVGFHTSYAALYFTFAAALCLFSISDLKYWYGNGKKAVLLTFIAFLSAIIFIFGIFVAGAKSGLISLFCLCCLYFYYEIFAKKRYYRSLFTVGGIVLFVSGLICLFPSVLDKMQQSITEFQHIHKQKDETLQGSTPYRIYFWKASLISIQEKPLFGHGTGDVKTVLTSHFSDTVKAGICQSLGLPNDASSNDKVPFNPHNQFFQTSIAVGLCGLLLLLSVFVFGLWWSFQAKSILFASLNILFFVNCLTESMLEVQAGIVFFCFFYFLFFIYLYPKISKRNIFDYKRTR